MENWFTLFSTYISSDLTLSIGKLVGVFFLAWIIHKFSSFFVEKLVRKMVTANRLSTEAEEKRENTLIKIINATLGVVLFIVVFLSILQEMGIAIGPMLATLGVVGVAVGFGGQYLIRDLISGIFIILENQYRVGDVVCFDGTCGAVEDITLRMTTLRDLDGTVHHIPHGEIKKVSNLTKYYARVNLNIGVAYDTDIEKLAAVIDEVGQILSEDPIWKDAILTPPKFLRIDDFTESAIVVKILGETKPTKQWEVAGELRKRIKVAFDKEGIKIPFPQRVIRNVVESNSN